MKSSEYLSFSRRERMGIIVLVLILVITTATSYVFKTKRFVVNTETARSENVPVEQTDHPAAPLTGNAVTDKEPEKKIHHTRSRYPNYSPAYKKRKPAAVIEINTADTTDFIALRGIGSKLASRIVLFRSKLGGFYNVKQIREVYGLKDSVFYEIYPYLRCDSSAIKKIDINAANREELEQHPYIRWRIAEALVAYRNQHGSFQRIADISKIEKVDSVSLSKFIPYITLR